MAAALKTSTSQITVGLLAGRWLNLKQQISFHTDKSKEAVVSDWNNFFSG